MERTNLQGGHLCGDARLPAPVPHTELNCCKLTLNVPGQSLMLQVSDSTESPRHVRPSPSGIGVSQLRDLVFVPPPHVVEQTDQSDQSPQLLFTLAERHKGNIIKNN